MTNVVIVAAGRTAVGSFNGSFAATPAHDLGAAVIEAALSRANLPADKVMRSDYPRYIGRLADDLNALMKG